MHTSVLWELYGIYAEHEWRNLTARDVPLPVGMLKPNGFGFFDMLGNAGIWCHRSHARGSERNSTIHDNLLHKRIEVKLLG